MVWFGAQNMFSRSLLKEEGELVTDTMKTAFTMQLLSLSCADVAIPESVV